MSLTTHDKRFAYLYKNGGKCITEPSMVPEEKKHLIQWEKPGPMWQKDINSKWWSKENIEEYRDTPIDSRMIDLHHKLLSFGGSETCFPVIEEDLVKILERGQLWLGDKTKMMKGRASQCHSNSCELYENNKNTHEVAIATGYALSADGLWRQHSWLVQRNTRSINIIETTVKRVLYFGFIMTEDEAEEFCYNCL